MPTRAHQVDPPLTSPPLLAAQVAVVVVTIAGCDRADPPVLPAGQDSVSVTSGPGLFRDVTAELGVSFTHVAGAEGRYHPAEIMAPGCAMLDYDGDGRLDLFLVTSDRRSSRDALYRQASDGRFEDVTESSALRAGGYGTGCAAADYDNDGHVDLYLTNLGPDELWRNRGDGTFENVTDAAGLGNAEWAASAAFFDFDRDGDLDLFVVNYLAGALDKACTDELGHRDYCAPQNFPPVRDRLYRNAGDGTFQEVTQASGIGNLPGPGLGVVTADFDADGWLDVYVANDQERNFLWLNRHDGTFEERGVELGCAYNRDGEAEAGMGIALGDAGGNGRQDLFITHFVDETNTLYVRSSSTGFTDDSIRSGLGPPSVKFTGFGTAFLDFDLDGDLDVVTANGSVRRHARQHPAADPDSPFARYAEPNQLFENIGEGRFRDVSAASGDFGRDVHASRGLAAGDLDQDGDLDLLVANAGGPARVYRNDAPRNGRWISVRAIVGTSSSRAAHGALVEVAANGRLHRRVQVAASSYASSLPPLVHFGLGDATAVDAVTVTWPDGRRETFTSIPIDSDVELQYGEGDASMDSSSR